MTTDTAKLLDEVEGLREAVSIYRSCIDRCLNDPMYGTMHRITTLLERANVDARAALSAKPVDDRIGKWLSAALEDPTTCAEMRADIEAWFASRAAKET